MANMANPGEKQLIDASSIIDMEVLDGDESDYETNITGNMSANTQNDPYGRERESKPTPYMEDVQKKVTQNVASYVWQSGSQQAKSYINTYANIDLLRPFFNVEPHEVRQRLLQSLIPQKPGSSQQKVPRELYGPTMLILTMIALLLYQMKTGGHTVQEGTLMGTAFGTCFGYWIGVSSLVWFLAYVCNSHITMMQILCLLGYALFGHCVVLGITVLFHTAHDHMFFYLMWALFGGLSTLRLVSVIMSRTAGQTQRLIVCGTVAVLHLCFLLYLHFAYHQMVEDLSDMMQHAGAPRPQINAADARQVAERSLPGALHTQDKLPKHPPGVVPTVSQLKVRKLPLLDRPEQANHAQAFQTSKPNAAHIRVVHTFTADVPPFNKALNKPPDGVAQQVVMEHGLPKQPVGSDTKSPQLVPQLKVANEEKNYGSLKKTAEAAQRKEGG